MDKAAIKLHKMNIFPKVPPLYTHLLSTFLPVFSGTMLPNGLPVSCLPPRTAFPRLQGRPEFHLHMSMTTKNGRPMAAPCKSHEQKRRYAHEGHTAFFGAANGIRVSPAGSVFRGSDSPPDCHSLPPRRPPLRHSKRVSQGNATTNKRHPRTKREVRGAPESH